MAAIWFTIAVLAFGVPAHPETPTPSTRSNGTRITVYGEIHESNNAKALWRKLFREAADGSTRVLVEILSIEDGLDRKIAVLKDFGVNEPAAADNLFGIESVFVKSAEILGLGFLQLIRQGAMSKQALSALERVVFEPQIQNLLFWLPLTDVRANETRMDLLQAAREGYAREFLRDHDSDDLANLFYFFRQRALRKAKEVTRFLHDVDVAKFPGTPQDYLTQGAAVRDSAMVDEIIRIAGSTPTNQKIAVIVGQLHHENIAAMLKEQLPSAEVTAIDIEKPTFISKLRDACLRLIRLTGRK